MNLAGAVANLRKASNWNLDSKILYGVYYEWTVRDVLDIDIKWVLKMSELKNIKLDPEILEYIGVLTENWDEINKDLGISPIPVKNLSIKVARRKCKIVVRKNK